MKRVAFTIWQCTWGIGATLIGLIVFMVYWGCPHSVFHGAVDTRWPLRNRGLGLGLFIFTPEGDDGYAERLRVHEYGHSVQSLVLGPLMLFVGIVSVAWSNLPWFVRFRKEKRVPYTACFVESWASKWGEMATGEDAIWD